MMIIAASATKVSKTAILDSFDMVFTSDILGTRAWLRVKRLRDAVDRAWLSAPIRNASMTVLTTTPRARWSRACATAFFLDG
jgi:hypothetical protein